MKKLFNALPGPAAIRILILIGAILVLLVALGFIFDAAGGLLDDGGTIG